MAPLADHLKMERTVNLRTDHKVKQWAFNHAWMLVLCFMIVIILELALVTYGIYSAL